LANETWGAEIDGYDSMEIEHEWMAEEKGEYEISVSIHDPLLDVIYADDEVTVTVEEEDDIDIPGYTISILILGVVVAFVIYYKKIIDKS